MPELPEVRAHAERLTEQFGGATCDGFRALSFTALKTATPPADAVKGRSLRGVEQRGKLLLLRFDGGLTAIVHLMQGGRLRDDPKRAAKPRGGLARWTFDDGRALLLTEAGTEHKAGVWMSDAVDPTTVEPLDQLGPEADAVAASELLALLHEDNQRVHNWLRRQSHVAGIGRRLANEVCFRAGLSPFTMTRKIDEAGARVLVEAIRGAIAEGLQFERARDDMSASRDRPGAVHHRVGEACPTCGGEIRSVEYSGYTVAYCPTDQTGGKILADNTTSRFLK